MLACGDSHPPVSLGASGKEASTRFRVYGVGFREDIVRHITTLQHLSRSIQQGITNVFQQPP